MENKCIMLLGARMEDFVHTEKHKGDKLIDIELDVRFFQHTPESPQVMIMIGFKIKFGLFSDLFSLSTLTTYALHYENFDRATFLKNECDELVEIVHSAYNHAQGLFKNKLGNNFHAALYSLPFQHLYDTKNRLQQLEL